MKTIVPLAITSVLLVGYLPCSAAGAPTTPDSSTDSSESVEILEITRHPPTKLSPLQHQNTSALAVSGTGVVAAFYGYDGAPRFFRTSTDGGLTWGREQASPDQMDGGQASGTLQQQRYAEGSEFASSFASAAETGGNLVRKPSSSKPIPAPHVAAVPRNRRRVDCCDIGSTFTPTSPTDFDDSPAEI